MESLNLEHNQRSTDHAENRPVGDDVLQDDPSTSTSQYRQTSPSHTFTDPFASGEPKQTPNGRLDLRHSYGPSSLTPAARTGPPRSLSFTYNYTIPSSFSSSNYINRNTGDILEEPTRLRALTESNIHDDPSTHGLTPRETQFRGPFDTTHPEQKDRYRDATDGRGKRREISRWDDFKSRWLSESLAGSPTEEKSGFDWGKDKDKEDAQPNGGPSPRKASSAVASDKGKGREPQETQTQGSKSPTTGWSRLRFLIPSVISPVSKESTPPSAVTTGDVNITDELLVGGLSVLMLRLWFERDERDRRRVPMLLHRLRIRISDSLHPLGGAQSVFRIECEYANGAMRWVIYRQLRDFLSLHAHYAVSNAYNRNVEKLPEFPRTSIPYFKFLKKESRERGGDVGRADFARLQREVLEGYLVNLIRAVMFHPTSNRLAGFLEVSALSIHLANSGGVQYKAGYLRIVASSSAGFGRKSAGRRQKKKQKWCAVRESYLVAVEEAGELAVWDVFLLDADFKIERPKRYYRQGLNLLHGDSTGEGGATMPDSASPNTGRSGDSTCTDRKALLGSIRSRLSHVLHPRSDSRHAGTSDAPGHGCERHVREDTEGDSLDPDSRPPTPMLDPSTNTNPLNEDATHAPHPPQGGAQNKKRRASGDVSKHTFYIENSQMKLKLYARSERQMLQWIAGLEKVAATSPFATSNRFGSFAPIRLNVAAQWLVDGRDYFWNLSRAILLAKDTIYIHDWWLSPELNLRRPGLPKYRLDKLLEKKAKEGVKIFIILYQEVSNRTTPTDSNYAKQRLSTLHPNILVQRSPSHFQTGTFYWAHHEKLCVIDSSIAFMGGLDLCFGRWDTPQHSLVDDPEEGEEPIWPGKDYSNARITDFHTLTKPEEDLHDRSKIPRMPWHDVGLQIVGQPARDLGRHFVQRWNYLLRIKNHSRLMPFLLPPPEYKPGELSQLGLTGTCELQICRSAGPWSLGTPDKVECSIQNAYLKAIQLSEHFVYIENQFFITSTMVEDVAIENKIGDAIVHRIIRAHREGTKWRCCIVIPLLPGFPFPVDHTDASSASLIVRIILECQNRTIGRGPNSIFSRLRKEGIDPDDHISLFSLRNWAKLRGDVLTTEIVYIHGKVCIVDDRLAIIGSANINERSQRGDRDSELAAVIRDTDLIDGKMAGKPFKVGRFSHTLRVRLMREHIGIDVDALDDEGVRAHGSIERGNEAEFWDPDNEQIQGREFVSEKGHHPAEKVKSTMRSVVDAIRPGDIRNAVFIHGTEDLGSKEIAQGLDKVGLESEPDSRGVDATVFADSLVPTLEEKILAEHHLPVQREYGMTVGKSLEGGALELGRSAPAEARVDSGHLSGASFAAEMDTQPLQARMGKRDADAEEQKALRARGTLRKQPNAKPGQSPWTILTPKPKFDANSFEDPVSDEFWTNIWVACAVHNTEIFRQVFHAVPDDLVTTWKHYREFVAHHERLLKPLRDDLAPEPVANVPSITIKERSSDEQGGQESRETSTTPLPDETQSHLTGGSSRGNHLKHEKSISERVDGPHAGEKAGGSMPTEKANGSATADKNKKTRGEPPFTKQERDEMETLLHELCGHLVVYPTRFLEGEDVAKNFLFNTDRLLPLPIYD
ncbi:phospholipase D [Lactarius hengduanensis]|nr:phospholipase D [Lactarius hengduanensis]